MRGDPDDPSSGLRRLLEPCALPAGPDLFARGGMSPDLQWVRPYDSELDLFGQMHRGDVRKHAHRGAGAGAEE
jgi:hypothetical protein